MNLSRTSISDTPLEIKLAAAFMIYNQPFDNKANIYCPFDDRDYLTINDWKSFLDTEFGKFMCEQVERSGIIEEVINSGLYLCNVDLYGVLYNFIKAYIQINYSVSIQFFLNGQSSRIFKEDTLLKNSEKSFDHCVPLLFCKAADVYSCRFICSKNARDRYGINYEHPFIKWFIDNCNKLQHYLPNLYRDLIDALRHEGASRILEIIQDIVTIIDNYGKNYGIDTNVLKRVKKDDFY